MANPFLIEYQGLLALVLSLAFIPILKRLALKVGLVDHPGGRKKQSSPIPLVGGIAIFISAGLLLYSGQQYITFKGLFFGASSLFFVGLIDDKFDLNATIRFALQAVIVTISLYIDGIWLTSLGHIAGVDLNLGIFQYPITIVAILGIINAINMLDGMDGLASGIIVLILFFILCLATVYESSTKPVASILLGSTFGFWLYNYRFPWRKKASVFMGDSGTTLLGFSLPYLAVHMTMQSGTPITLDPSYLLWLFAVPLWDISAVILRRIKSGRSPFLAGRDHIHHILLNHNFSVTQTVLLIYALTVSSLFLGTSLLYFGFGSAILYLIFTLALFAYIKRLLKYDQVEISEVIDINSVRAQKESQLE